MELRRPSSHSAQPEEVKAAALAFEDAVNRTIRHPATKQVSGPGFSRAVSRMRRFFLAAAGRAQRSGAPKTNQTSVVIKVIVWSVQDD